MASAWNVPQISFLCGSAELSNKNMFKTFLRTYPEYEQMGHLMVELAESSDWQSVGILFNEAFGFWNLIRVSMSNVFEP